MAERFKNDRLTTTGIRSCVPAHLVALMWSLIDNMEIEQKDSYQFFTLSVIGEDDTRVQVIEHTQEQPEYHSPIVYVPFEPYWSGRVYVIDDGSASVMCLPQER